MYTNMQDRHTHFASNFTPNTATFKAPAHRHARHLHSIPPKEKSTRTLIIDHMLWVHGRTRFAQARAELGMTDRSGGSSSANYVHRERPENFEEDEELLSDGEDARILDAREGDINNDDEDERISCQDLVFARTLRLRAEALEKVVTSMLDQPPPVHPHFDGNPVTPPSSPKPQDPLHPHTLPNGVRVRITLGTIINDLFARQAPPEPYRHHYHPVPIVVSSGNLSGSSSQNNSPVIPKNISVPMSQIPPLDSLPPSAMPAVPPAVIPLSTISAASPMAPALLSVAAEFRSSGFPSGAMPTPNRPLTSNGRVRSLYGAGADRSANTQTAFRCPRHLHTGCEICVEAKSFCKIPRGRTGSTTGWTATSPGKNTNEGGARSGHNPSAASKDPAGSGGGITGWQDGSGIGSGLARPDVDGSVLRRRSWSALALPEASNRTTGTGAGNTKLSELIPRFLRLSALVAIELGSEVRDEEVSDKVGSGLPDGPTPPISSSSSAAGSTYNATREKQRMHANALRPSKEWYMLLIGLLTRAALEGYLTGGWRGTEAVDCLLTVGLGMVDAPENQNERDGPTNGGERQVNDDSEVGDEFKWFDPDGFPNLREAARIMFPSLQASRTGTYQRREGAEVEYEQEISERLRRFYAIPTKTPDLSTHMEDLAWHYPAEPIERAAVRWCEAVAKWRGKPELETYKKKQLTIDSLVHSNPTSPTAPTPKPPLISLGSKGRRLPIERYFEDAPAWNSNKRRRLSDVGRFGSGKRLHG